jgi:hypothetical protein
VFSVLQLRSSEQEIGHALIEAGLSEESRKAIIEVRSLREVVS